MMTDIFENAYDEILTVGSLEQYQTLIEEYAQKLDIEGLTEDACNIRELSKIPINRFSKQATKESFECSRSNLLAYLKKRNKQADRLSQREAVKIIKLMLENFSDYCRCLYKDKIHENCSDPLKTGLSYLSMENEYDIQRLMYPLLRSVFADARMEETEDSGHHTIRKDIVIDSYDIVIELKCSGKSMTERRISEEIASDMVHYGNRFLFFYIFDKENVIKNAVDFQNTYERKKINNKEIYLHIWQSNTI